MGRIADSELAPDTNQHAGHACTVSRLGLHDNSALLCNCEGVNGQRRDPPALDELLRRKRPKLVRVAAHFVPESRLATLFASRVMRSSANLRSASCRES